eukprot:CAMPEP_0198211788 /NCGR_PEP_ID=MMETSP1445-20131203/25344_1 /TAXON_ID=36898 /ORGANISM="Pyramimonas sp., Strain CCMP2087" /LENGTH=151 /DNA_ID=CAMNT_0043886123 /DNA_START=26 /DNA_END=481 /DNA_ORIENTATION=+
MAVISCICSHTLGDLQGLRARFESTFTSGSRNPQIVACKKQVENARVSWKNESSSHQGFQKTAGNARRVAQVYLGSTLLTSCGVAQSALAAADPDNNLYIIAAAAPELFLAVSSLFAVLYMQNQRKQKKEAKQKAKEQKEMESVEVAEKEL